MRILCACSAHANRLHTSWMYFLIFPPVQGDTRTALGGAVRVVPSRCLSASWSVGMFSVNLKHTYAWLLPGEQAFWFPSCYSLCNSGLQCGE